MLDLGRRIGILLVNPGGPGAPASQQVQSIVAPAQPGVAPSFGPELVARYDFVGMDPRGVGASGQVRCLSDAEREAKLAGDLNPSLPAGLPRPELEAEARKFSEACGRSNDRALLAQLSTDNVARDMDQVRAALGEETISYLGTSYGTLLGATYATLFPKRVRHMVLDAPVHPERWQQDPLAASLDQAVGGKQLLQRYFETCQAEGPACPFGAGRPAEAFDALVKRLEAQPLPTPAAGNVPAGKVDGAIALLAARVAMFKPQLWPVLTLGLVAAEAGNGTLLYRLANALARDPDGKPSGLERPTPASTAWTGPSPRTSRRMTATPSRPRSRPRVSATCPATSCWPVRHGRRRTPTPTSVR